MFHILASVPEWWADGVSMIGSLFSVITDNTFLAWLIGGAVFLSLLGGAISLFVSSRR